MQSYHRIDPATEARVEELLGRMSLDEKVGQLVLESPFAPVDWGTVIGQMKQAEESGQPFKIPQEVRADFPGRLRTGKVGAVMSGNAPVTNHLQRRAVAESRLSIPLLVGLDVIHGFRTIFPIPLAEASTWNPELLEQAARVAAEEASAAGVNWIFAPMVDVSRDPRWGRIAEGADEDTFLGGEMARVRGFWLHRELPFHRPGHRAGGPGSGGRGPIPCWRVDRGTEPERRRDLVGGERALCRRRPARVGSNGADSPRLADFALHRLQL